MGNVMAYSGITTKVRAMSAKLLTAEDYDTIAGLGTVTEAIEYLKDKTAYAPYVNRMDISLYHRGNVEKILYQSLFDDYSRLFRFAGMKQKTFLKLYWKRYESGNVLYFAGQRACVRQWGHGTAACRGRSLLPGRQQSQRRE